MNGYMKLNPNSLRYTKKYIINLFLTLMFDLNNYNEEQHRYKKKKEWNAIKKDSSWDSSTGNYTIYCTDGEITK